MLKSILAILLGVLIARVVSVESEDRHTLTAN